MGSGRVLQGTYAGASMTSMNSFQNHVEAAFGWRPIPKDVVDSAEIPRSDSDIEEAVWFAGRNWRQVAFSDWQEHPVAVSFFSSDAFGYYLQSILILSAETATESLEPANRILGKLDRSPDVTGWDQGFTGHFFTLTSEELTVMKEWLLCISSYSAYKRRGPVRQGPGDRLGRCFDTLDLLQRRLRESAWATAGGPGQS